MVFISGSRLDVLTDVKPQLTVERGSTSPNKAKAKIKVAISSRNLLRLFATIVQND